ncbi:hypothetical protein HPB48_026580 [Haemaphysalis longicornis]|uniref:GH18 domain-containing protein n=1 Tax=Haemaphysalis longicornis TaxID=44386 RepID=A0A9J6HB39_HAELO|nr:hypothetical protein HPB48_026580 [Haemaphysalis longicornis]
MGRSRRAVVSRQKSGNEEAPLLCLYDRNTERGKNPTPYQLLKHLPASFCTHLVYGFVSPVDLNGGPSPAHPSQAGPIKDAERRIGQMVALKKFHPTLRVLLGVGGPKVDSQSFSDQLSTEGQRDRFAKRSVRWLQARRLDGMHVQWMYPGEGNGRPTDRQNFPKLLSQLRRAFKSQSGSRWHLTLYLPHDHTQIDRGYELRNAVNSVHYAVFAAFGFSEPGLAEVTSPLYNQPPTVEGVSPVNSIHELVLLLLDRGAPSNKLLLGLSATGLSYNPRQRPGGGAGAAARRRRPRATGSLLGHSGPTGVLRDMLQRVPQRLGARVQRGHVVPVRLQGPAVGVVRRRRLGEGQGGLRQEPHPGRSGARGRGGRRLHGHVRPEERARAHHSLGDGSLRFAVRRACQEVTENL